MLFDFINNLSDILDIFEEVYIFILIVISSLIIMA